MAFAASKNTELDENEYQTKKEKKAAELFTDREEPRKAFWNLYNELNGGIDVITYYGIGGIGKSSLILQLQREMTEKIENGEKDYAFFSFEGKAGEEEFLISLSKQIMQKCKDVNFDVFYTAMIKLFLAQGKDISLLEQRIDNSLKSGAKETGIEVVKDVFAAASGISYIGSIASLAKTVTNGIIKPFLEKKSQENGNDKKAYDRIAGSDEKILKEDLPFYFSYDLNKVFEKRGKPFVVFIDGYENLVDVQKEERSQAEMHDRWLKKTTEPGKGLIVRIPNILWVIAGREKISWDPSILPDDHQHLIGELSEKDASSFFQRAGITETTLIPDLYCLTKGVPVYLDICAELYFKISNERKPVIEDFGRDTTKLAERWLEKLGEAQYALIGMLSCFPNTWEREMAEAVAKDIHVDRYLDRLNEVLSMTLIEKIGNGYRLHETIRTVTRERIGKEKASIGTEAAAGYLKERLFEMDKTTVRMGRLGQLADVMQAGLCSKVFTDEDIVKISDITDKETEDSGLYFEGRQIFDAIALYMEGKEYGIETQVRCENDRNWNMYQRGEYTKMSEAVAKTYEKAKVLGEEHPDTLRSLNNLAISYYSLGENQKAKELHEICYEAKRHILGEEHRDTLMSLDNLAGSYHVLGETQKAKELYEICYEARKRIWGEEDPETLTSLNNLAVSYYSLGEKQKAKELREICYEAMRHILGEEHPDTLTSLNNLACSYNDLGEKQKAKELWEICYEARRHILGEEHPATLTSLNALAVSYNALGEKQKAKELQEICYEAMRHILGEEHPDTLGSLNNLANSYNALGEKQKAKELREICYEARRHILGEEHPDTLESLNALACSYNDLGEKQKAKELYEICYEARKRILGEEHPETLRSLNNLANSYDDLGEKQKAKELWEICYEARKRILGEEHPDTLRSLNNLAYSYNALGEKQKAKELWEICYKARKRILGEEHHDTLVTKKNLDYVYSVLNTKETPSPVAPVQQVTDTPEYRKLLSLRFEVEKTYQEIQRRMSEFEGFHLFGKKKMKNEIEELCTKVFNVIDEAKRSAKGVEGCSDILWAVDSYETLIRKWLADVQK